MAANESVTKIKVNYEATDAIKGFRNLKSSIAGIISTLALHQIYAFTNALAKAGAEGKQTEKAFNKFVPNVAKATAELNKAAMGMVEDTKLQQRAIQAMISGIKFDDYVTALEYASKFAISTGQDTEQVLDGILTSFVTGRAISLKRAGIVVNTGKNMVVDATNQMKLKMKELDVSVDDPIVKMQQLNAQLDNIKQQIGIELIPTVAAWNTGLIEMAKYAGEAAKSLSGFVKYLAVLTTSGGDKELTSLRLQIESAKQLEDKNASLLVLKSLQTKNTQTLSLAEQKRNDVVKKQTTGLFKDEKDRYGDRKKAEDEINKLLGIQQEITGAIYAIENKREQKKGTFKPTPLGESDEDREKRNKKEIDTLDKQIDKINRAEEYRNKKKKELYDQDVYWSQKAAEERVLIQNTEDEIRKANLEESLDGRLQLLEEEYVKKQLIIGQSIELDKWYLSERDKLYKEGFYQTGEGVLDTIGDFTNVLQQFSDRGTQRELDNLDRKKMGEKRYNKERERILKEQEQQERAFARAQQLIILGQTIMDIAKGSGTALKKGFFGIPELIFVAAQGALQIASIQAQHFQRGYLGEVDRSRRSDNINAQIGSNEAVIPGPQYAMHADDVRAIVNNTANTAAGLRSLRGGSVVHNYYGLSSEQVIAVQRDAERRKYTGRLI